MATLRVLWNRRGMPYIAGIRDDLQYTVPELLFTASSLCIQRECRPWWSHGLCHKAAGKRWILLLETGKNCIIRNQEIFVE